MGTYLKGDAAQIPFIPVVRGIATFTVLMLSTIFYGFQISPLSLSRPLMVSGFNAVLLCVLATGGAHIGRAYARDRQNMKEQLSNFRISNANCTCCHLKHVDPVTKQAIECDRPVVEGAIQVWFARGGLQEFDKHVQEWLYHRVLQAMPGCLGYTEMLYASLPVVWFELSKVGLDCGTSTLVVRRLFWMMGDWLAFNPFCIVLLMMMTNFVRTRRADWRCDHLVTGAIAFGWVVISRVLSYLVMLTFTRHCDQFGGLLVCAIFLPVTVLLIRFPATRCWCG